MQDADIGACYLGESIMAYDAKGSRCGGLRLRLVVGSDRSGFVALLEFCRAAAEAPDPVGVRVFRRGLRQFDPTSHLRNGGGAAAIGLRRRPVAM